MSLPLLGHLGMGRARASCVRRERRLEALAEMALGFPTLVMDGTRGHRPPVSAARMHGAVLLAISRWRRGEDGLVLLCAASTVPASGARFRRLLDDARQDG